MTNQQLTIAARLTGERWEAALVADGKFQKAFVGERGETLGQVVGTVLTALLAVQRNEGTELGISLSINEPDSE
jgi:hypothetical protein